MLRDAANSSERGQVCAALKSCHSKTSFLLVGMGNWNAMVKEKCAICEAKIFAGFVFHCKIRVIWRKIRHTSYAN